LLFPTENFSSIIYGKHKSQWESNRMKQSQKSFFQMLSTAGFCLNSESKRGGYALTFWDRNSTSKSFLLTLNRMWEQISDPKPSHLIIPPFLPPSPSHLPPFSSSLLLSRNQYEKIIFYLIKKNISL
jgi:hypothetical protein